MFTRTTFFPKAGIIALITISFQLSLNAQTPGPEPEWLREDWARSWSGPHQLQEESGDDWWNNHTKIYENGVHVGYIAVGYSTWDDATVDLASQNNCYEYTASSPYCTDFEVQNDIKGFKGQTAARYALDGTMLWCRKFNQGEFFGVYQDSQDNILLIGFTESVKDLSSSANPIGYNPTVINPNGTVATCTDPDDFSSKMNIIKMDIDGTIEWNYTYGNTDVTSSNWKTEASSGKALIEYDGGYRAIGSSNNNVPPPFMGGNVGFGFMLQIDLNGRISGTPGKQIYSVPHPTRPNNYLEINLRGIKKSANGHIAVSGSALDYQIYGSNIDQDALILHFDGTTPANSFTLATTTLIDAWTTQLSPNPDLAKTVFLEYLSVFDVFAVPVFSGALTTGNSGSAEVEIRFYASDFNTQTQVPIKITAGDYKAYDLLMGITEVDGGFATVSTKQQGAPPSFNATLDNILTDRFPGHDPIANPNGATCNIYDPNNPSRNDDVLQFWDTDASVARYSITTGTPTTVTKLWESTFDVDNQPREFWPGDIKRQECLYSIAQDDLSGAFTISGNTSSNFDDNYLVKLYPDDCIGLTYDIHDNSDDIYDITSNTSWNSSKTVLGQLVVKSGNTLTISGSSTEIKFADSKRTGVKTNLLIEKNAKVIVDGATLTSDDRCEGGYWDGIIIDGDNSNDQFPLSSPTHQGKLVLKNNALLDRARYTITFGKGGQWNNFGGLVEAEDATIKCVRRAVEFMSYPHTNHSYFKRCTFEYVGGINEIPLPLVTAWDNNGVVFAGCTFADYSGINEYSDIKANGIFSIDASYSVVSDCNFPPSIPPVMPCPWEYNTRSSFINLNQGIYATGSGGLQTITVDETDFIDNSMACRIEGVDNVRFTRNTTLAGGLLTQR